MTDLVAQQGKSDFGFGFSLVGNDWTRHAMEVAVVVHGISMFIELAILQGDERTADQAVDLA